MTYAELHRQAVCFALGLRRLGVSRGDVVTLHLPNCPQFAVAYYGLLMAGAVFSPCFPLAGVSELRDQLNDSGAGTLVTLDLFIDTVRAVRAETGLRRVIVTGLEEITAPATAVDTRPFGAQTYSFRQLVADAGAPPAPAPALAPVPASVPVPVDPDNDLAHLIYTGRSSGRGRGVMLTHRAVVANTLQFAHWSLSGRPVLGDDGVIRMADIAGPGEDGAWEYPMVPGRSLAVVVVPWTHVMGPIGYLNSLIYAGATLVVHPRFDPAAYVDDVVAFKATSFGGAGPVLQGILGVPGVYGLDLSPVRFIPVGPSALPPAVFQDTANLVPGAIIAEGYGITELTTLGLANPANRSGKRKPGSVGIPVFDTDVKIVDLDDPDLEIGLGELGEICVTGPQVMAGYRQLPEETAAVLRSGWVHTGEVGYMDDDGFVFIVDRKKDVLVYRGFNVYPRELEEILGRHRAVAGCVVIGKPAMGVGEIPKAFVALRPGRQASPEELMALVNERVARHKWIREVEFVESIPVDSAGRPLRRRLREWEAETALQGELSTPRRRDTGNSDKRRID